MDTSVNTLPQLPRTAELVIVGGGIVGAASAFFAARAGLSPLIVERRPRLCTLTTPVATGAFRLQFDNQAEMEMIRRSVDLFLNFEEMTEQREYAAEVQQQGYLWLTTSNEGVERQQWLIDLQYGWGLSDVELLSGDEVRRRFPYVGPGVLQARFRAGDGFLDQKQVTMGLAAASGAGVVTNCGVTGFQVRDGRLTGVETEQGLVSTDLAVIAAGPFSGVVAAMAGLSLPVRTVVRQKIVMPWVPEVPPHAPMTIDEDTGAHWRPALQGAYLLFTDPRTPPSPPAEDITPEHRFAFRVLDPASPVSVARVVPFWEHVWERGSANWMVQGGQYTMTPDHRPLIGPTPIDGLFVNSGYSGHGVMGSPAGSEILAGTLTGVRPPGDNPFRLDRAFESRDHDVL